LAGTDADGKQQMYFFTVSEMNLPFVSLRKGKKTREKKNNNTFIHPITSEIIL